MTRSMKLVLGAVCSVLLLAACGGNDESTSTSTHDMGAMSMPMSSTAASSEIVISGNAFTVPESVRHGQIVTVRNNDAVEHSVTADDGTFNVEVEPGQTTTFTAPATPDAYAFHCTYHPNMKATLKVTS